MLGGWVDPCSLSGCVCTRLRVYAQNENDDAHSYRMYALTFVEHFSFICSRRHQRRVRFRAQDAESNVRDGKKRKEGFVSDLESDGPRRL